MPVESTDIMAGGFDADDYLKARFCSLMHVAPAGAFGTPWGYVIEQSALFPATSNSGARVALTSPSSSWAIMWWDRIHSPTHTDGFFFTFDTKGVGIRTTSSLAMGYDGSGYTDGTAALRDVTAWNANVVICDAGSLTWTRNGQTVLTDTITLTGTETYLNIGSYNNASNRINANLTHFAYVEGTSAAALSYADFVGTDAASGEAVPKPESAITALVDAGDDQGGYWPDLDGGADVSSHGNALTVGADVSSSPESPTDNRAGTVGCFATGNLLIPHETGGTPTYSNGNRSLASTSGSSYSHSVSTLGFTTGKFIVGLELTSGAASASNTLGLTYAKDHLDGADSFTDVESLAIVGVDATTLIRKTGPSLNTTIKSSTTVSTSDWWVMAVDADAGKVWFGWYDQSSNSFEWLPATDAGSVGDPAVGTNPTHTFTPSGDPLQIKWTGIGVSGAAASMLVFDTADFPGAVTIPTGFKPLNTASLLTVTGSLSDHFATVLYSGNGTAIGSGGNAITGVGFQPDFVWAKSRTSVRSHAVFDSLRGAGERLNTDMTGAEATTTEGVVSFDGDGFTVGNDPNVNENTEDFAAWCARLPSSETNSSGTISVDWKYNAMLGMAVGAYTGNGTAGATLGLPTITGNAPIMVVVKNRSTSARSWIVQHTAANASPGSGGLILDGTTAFVTESTYWNNTAATSSVITLGTNSQTNTNTDDYLIIVFWETAFCRSIQYEGNASADGPIWYGHGSPQWAVIKNADAVRSWNISDKTRSPFNVMDDVLEADASSAETTNAIHNKDFLATGLKVRSTHETQNGSGHTQIGVAIVEPLGVPGAAQRRAR